MTMVFVCCLYFSEILFLFLHLPLQFLLAYHQLNGIVNLMIELEILSYQLNGIFQADMLANKIVVDDNSYLLETES